MFEFVSDLEYLKLVGSCLVVWLAQPLVVTLDMFHLDFLVLVEFVVFVWVAEGLVGAELFFDHTLQHTIVRELLLQLIQLLAHLPLVFWLRKLFHPCLVQLGFLLFGSQSFLLFLLFKFFSLSFFVDVVLNNFQSVSWTVGLILAHKVNQIYLSVSLEDLDVVQLQSLLFLSLRLAHVLSVGVESFEKFSWRKEFADSCYGGALVIWPSEVLLLRLINLFDYSRVIAHDFLASLAHYAEQLQEELVLVRLFLREHAQIIFQLRLLTCERVLHHFLHRGGWLVVS